nr:hypothetical protein [uncultured Allomuricauda sp.]
MRVKKYLLLCFLIIGATSIQSQEESNTVEVQGELIPVDIEINKSDGVVSLFSGGQQMSLNGSLFELESTNELSTEWSVEKGLLTTLSLNVFAHSNAILERVKWLKGTWEPAIEQEIQSTKLMDNALFLRKNGVSIFISLDFPFSEIDSNGIHYPPNIALKKGGQYAAHTLTIGACKLTGEKVGKFDKAEIEAFSSYVEKRFKPRFERPLTIFAGITNRMTDVREGRIFYSMFDNPTIATSPDLVVEDLELCKEVGIEYYQVFEGVFDWPDTIETGNKYKKIIKKAKKLGVRIGDYTVPQGLYCPHYNYSHREVGRPDWLIVDEEGQKVGPECLAVKEYYKILFDRILGHNRKFNLQLICLDFLNINPCYNTDHGHKKGDVYQQILALVHLMKELNKIDPNFQIWSNSGNWIELMPKLTWYNQNVYLTDPHIREYAPHLNALKILGDGRREQMVSVHETHFVPYRNFTNYEYYLAPKSRVSDTKFLEYSFLQGLCVTPNIGFGELRTLLDRIPYKEGEKFKKFIKHWLGFISENYDTWKYTKRLGGLPGKGTSEVYGHIKNDKGFICLLNQNPFSTSASVSIDKSIGLKSGNKFVLNEIYPKKAPIYEQALPYALRGDTLNFNLEPHSVRIIEISPQKKQNLPVIYGASSKVTTTKNGYDIAISLPQGVKRKIGLVLPEDQAIESVTAAQSPTVGMYTFPVSASIGERKGNLAHIEIQAPREKAPKSLNHWRIGPSGDEVELPTDNRQGFMGAYVHNAFSEEYEVILSVSVKPIDRNAQRIFPENPKKSMEKSTVPALGNMTYTTDFILPFIELWGVDRPTNNDAVIELVFSDPDKVERLEVALDGKKIPVLKYRNPKKPTFETFYIELAGHTGPGNVSLELDVTYK